MGLYRLSCKCLERSMKICCKRRNQGLSAQWSRLTFKCASEQMVLQVCIAFWEQVRQFSRATNKNMLCCQLFGISFQLVSMYVWQRGLRKMVTRCQLQPKHVFSTVLSHVFWSLNNGKPVSIWDMYPCVHVWPGRHAQYIVWTDLQLQWWAKNWIFDVGVPVVYTRIRMFQLCAQDVLCIIILQAIWTITSPVTGLSEFSLFFKEILKCVKELIQWQILSATLCPRTQIVLTFFLPCKGAVRMDKVRVEGFDSVGGIIWLGV